MRRLLLAAIALAALSASATAAQMVTKALPPSPFLSPNGSGWYVDVGTEAGVASSSVSGTTFPTLSTGSFNAAGGGIGGGFGYIWGAVPIVGWARLESDAFYQNISGGNGSGSAVSRWSATQEVDIGAQVLQTIASVFPNLTSSNGPFPTFNPSSLLPSALAVATTPRQYIGFVAEEYGISGSLGAAGGTSWGWAPGVKTGFLWQTLNSAGKPNGGALDIYAQIDFPQNGVVFDNVFGAGGAPVVTGASASMQTQYWVGVKYDFGL